MTKLETEKIYKEYKGKVERYVSGKIADKHDAEDLVSSVFLKVYHNIDSFDNSKASISTWIYSITRNTVIDYFRTHKELCRLEIYAADDYKSDESVEQEEILSELADALASLGQRERDLIILHYYDGKTLKSIAADFGMSYINAKIIHKKALHFLKTKLK